MFLMKDRATRYAEAIRARKRHVKNVDGLHKRLAAQQVIVAAKHARVVKIIASAVWEESQDAARRLWTTAREEYEREDTELEAIMASMLDESIKSAKAGRREFKIMCRQVEEKIG